MTEKGNRRAGLGQPVTLSYGNTDQGACRMGGVQVKCLKECLDINIKGTELGKTRKGESRENDNFKDNYAIRNKQTRKEHRQGSRH